MTYPRILLLEDVEFDRELIRSTLTGAGVDGRFYCVDTREAFLAVLKHTNIDLILADNSLPYFDGFSALEIVRSHYPDIPFILVTGVLGEELAIETLKQGATDYVLKQRLNRLVPAVNRALRERQERQARVRAEKALKASEDRFRISVETMLDCFGIFSTIRDDNGQIVDFRIEYVNRAAVQQLSFHSRIAAGQSLAEHLPIRAQAELFKTYAKVVETGKPLVQESLLYSDGELFQTGSLCQESDNQRSSRHGQTQPLGGGARQPALMLALDIRATRLGDGVVVTWRDITARKRAEQEREELLAREQAAREEAERVSRVKDEFLSTLSHELRTPLNAMQGWLQMLQRRGLTDHRAEQALQTIQRNLDGLKRLIEDALDVSRIIRGELKLSTEVLEIRPVLLAAIEAVLPAIQAKQLRLSTDLELDSIKVTGDRTRLQQIFWNLLSNAAKFTGQGGCIDVRLRRLEGQAEVQVQDTGQGIDAALVPHVFERFYQGDSSTTRAHSGLGLGLAIARHLVEMHGGNISVESQGSQQGATFTVLIPLQDLRTSLDSRRQEREQLNPWQRQQSEASAQSDGEENRGSLFTVLRRNNLIEGGWRDRANQSSGC
jgi:signal transduction histidine kinase/CheY-like chemotaxis protein